MDAQCRIGTCGWSYASWSGRIYPAGARPGEWLGLLAQQVDAIEVAASAFAIPGAQRLARWREAVGPDGCLALTAWHGISYGKRLRDCAHELERIVAGAVLLGPCRGPLLVQIPPSLHYDLTLLADFLVELETARSGVDLRVVLEFRDPEWLCPALFELCDRHGVAVCGSDLPRSLSLEPNDADFVYLRRHGPDGRVHDPYPADLIARDADDIAGYLDAGRDVYVFYHNTVAGHAVHDAKALAARLARVWSASGEDVALARVHEASGQRDGDPR